jgi:hypothetical protein
MLANETYTPEELLLAEHVVRLYDTLFVVAK